MLKIFEVFTEKYKKETEYREFISKMNAKFKLNDEVEDIDNKIKLISDKNYKSNFSIKVNYA